MHGERFGVVPTPAVASVLGAAAAAAAAALDGLADAMRWVG